ncbi:MAG: hypothetical protein JW712_02985 [Dehalococcoidales bacterium]|nr:hypothetical protein [Dehalococcoidales bacterium]
MMDRTEIAFRSGAAVIDCFLTSFRLEGGPGDLFPFRPHQPSSAAGDIPGTIW